MDGYLLGILWGCCTPHHNRLLCRHKDKYYPDYVASQLGGHVRTQMSRTGIQYTVNIPIEFEELYKFGWTLRNNDVRVYPKTDDDKGFCSAWIELHHSADLGRRKDGTRHPRLRIYGNYVLMESIESKISIIANVGQKSILRLHNEKSAEIYYQSYNEITRIRDVFVRNPHISEKIGLILSL
ncbi:hypothetical protein LY85_3316 [Clostridium sp. KNHs216]|nr:hypothetical protein LY85_3316 [Clostridium sp. KNHs216]